MGKPRRHGAYSCELLRDVGAPRQLALLGLQTHLAQRLLQRQEQVGSATGLDEIGEGAGAHRRGRRFHCRISGEHDDGRVGMLTP